MRTLVETIFIIMLLLVEFLGFVGFFTLIGLWWHPEFSGGEMNVSLIKATLLLVLTLSIFYKHVIEQRRVSTPLHFYFYSSLAICSLTGYMYGIIFRWL